MKKVQGEAHPKFFANPQALREWFSKNHKTAQELVVGYYKKSTGIPSIDWSQSVDQALCFGWIDGIRKRIDEKSYQIRFTPRNPKSHWSEVNINKVKKLIKSGSMQPAGMEVWQKRDKKNARRASYEQKNVKLAKEYEEQLKAHHAAWDFFKNKLAPSYKKASIHWIMSAKQEKTRQRRLEILIESSAKEEKIPPLNIAGG